MTRFPDTAVDIAARLIKLNTVTGSDTEASALHMIADLFEDNGEYEQSWSDALDAVVIIPRAAVGPLLVLSGHVDTVPFDPYTWSFDPLCGEVEGGNLLGRGASDMKSGIGAQVAAMLHAGPTAPVALALSTQEEWGCAGTPQVIAALRKAEVQVGALLVAEPTDGKLLLGHKGPLWLEVQVDGVAAHGSSPERGSNAIVKAARLILRAEAELPRRTHWRLGTETINVGLINGGTMRNVVPDRVQLGVDLRTVDPDQTTLTDWFLNQPEVADVQVVAHHLPVWTDAEEPWVEAIPLPPDPTPAGFGTEAAPLGQAFGSPPTVIWGPGPRDQMHVVDEKCPVQFIKDAAEGYVEAIQAWSQIRED